MNAETRPFYDTAFSVTEPPVFQDQGFNPYQNPLIEPFGYSEPLATVPLVCEQEVSTSTGPFTVYEQTGPEGLDQELGDARVEILTVINEVYGSAVTSTEILDYVGQTLSLAEELVQKIELTQGDESGQLPADGEYQMLYIPGAHITEKIINMGGISKQMIPYGLAGGLGLGAFLAILSLYQEYVAPRMEKGNQWTYDTADSIKTFVTDFINSFGGLEGCCLAPLFIAGYLWASYKIEDPHLKFLLGVLGFGAAALEYAAFYPELQNGANGAIALIVATSAIALFNVAPVTRDLIGSLFGSGKE